MNKKTVTVKARINEDLKKAVEKKLEKLGLTPSDVIRMLYAKINSINAISFDLNIPCEQTTSCDIPHIPNKETIEVIEKAERGEDLHYVENIEQLKKEIVILNLI